MKVHFISGEGFDANVYLIDGETTVLIDTGVGWNTPHIAEKAKKIAGKVDRILLTHRHIDHVGGAKELSELLEAELYIYVEDAPPLVRGDQISTGARMFGCNVSPMKVKTLEKGEVIDLGDYKLEVIHTPGHTIGSAVFYEREKKTLFSGDTVFTNGGVGRWDLDTGNYKQLLESLKLLNSLEVEALYPGHGPYVEEGGNEHIEMGLSSLRFYEDF